MKFRLRTIQLACVLAGIGGQAAAQVVAPPDSDFAFQVKQLATIVASQDGSVPANPDPLGNAYSFTGVDQLAETTFPFPDAYRKPCAVNAGTGEATREADALATILTAIATKKPRVVMLNEAHHRAYNRAFASQLIMQLRKLGYNTLALETLSPRGAAGGPVTAKSGYYTNEPTFAAMLRDATQAGFKLVEYEADFSQAPETDTWSWREKTQAENLSRNSRISEDPTVKLIVYAGYGHISDAFMPSADDMSKTFMAGWFRKQTGLDPFSISQTGCTSQAQAKPDDLGYRVAVAVDSGVYSSGKGIDIVVRPGAPEYLAGRGTWRLAGARQKISLPKAFLTLSPPYLVEAREVGAGRAEVPYDRVAILKKEDVTHNWLALPDGAFELVAVDAEGKIIGRVVIQ